MPGVSQGSDARLTVVHGREGEDGGALLVSPSGGGRPALRLVEDGSSLLIAGADPVRRLALLEELSRTMPEGTSFEQAGTFAEVLEHAPSSRMVILADGLDEASPRSLIRVLSQRHPALPVITVDAADARDL